jgi:ABC-type uncharacterized transport system substrate-binding protein
MLAARLLLVASLAAPAAAGSVVLKPRSESFGLTDAIVRALSGGARVIELTGDDLADASRLARESKGQPVLFAVGPKSAEVAGEARGTAVVSLGVANPAQVRTPGTYISFYPRLDKVFEYLRDTLKAKAVGFVFTPSRNREIALGFVKAGEAAGVAVIPVTVGSTGDLYRSVKPALGRVDALLLAIGDPVTTSRESVEYVVEQAQAARKPTVGFLEGLTREGVTLALVAPASAMAKAASEAAQQPQTVGKKRVEVDEMQVVVSPKAAAAIGTSPEALGARR